MVLAEKTLTAKFRRDVTMTVKYLWVHKQLEGTPSTSKKPFPCVFTSNSKLGPGGVLMRLVVADEHPLILSGFRSSFSSSRDIRIVAECRDRPAVREALLTHEPSVVALDAELYEGGSEQPDALVSEFPKTSFVWLSSRNDLDLGRHAMRTGIRGIIAKSVH